MPHIVFAFVLGYICMSHIYRTYVDYMGWSLDFTGPQVREIFRYTAPWRQFRGSRFWLCGYSSRVLLRPKSAQLSSGVWSLFEPFELSSESSFVPTN